MSDKNFEQLLAELQATAQGAEQQQTTLAKALPQDDGADDKAIQAAAAEGDEHDEGAEPEEGEEGEEGDGDEPQLMKSLTIDGEEVQVLDGEQVLKSLGDLSGRVTAHEQMLTKALAQTLNTVQAQGNLIKSLTERVEQLAGQGKGRKTVVAITPKQEATLAKSEPQGVTAQEFMLKANAAFDAGKITGHELNVADVSLRNGVPVQQAIVNKVLA